MIKKIKPPNIYSFDGAKVLLYFEMTKNICGILQMWKMLIISTKHKS